MSFYLVVAASTVVYAQTDVAASLYGAFPSATSYGPELQNQPNAVGGLFEFRHIRNPLIGYEVTYSFNRANQILTYIGTTFAGSGPSVPVTIYAHAHEITGDWLFSTNLGKLKPFALAGMGVMITEPGSGQSQTTSSTAPVFVYGAGVDWKLISHFGLRFQYRGNVYKAPHISTAYGSNGSFMHTAEPTIGAYFRF